MGLSRQHHSELNRYYVAPGRYDELRRLYAGDNVAQQQIDVYDPNSPYQPLLRAYGDALKSGDIRRADVIERELRARYPDI